MIQVQSMTDTLLIAPISSTAAASATYDLLGIDYATIRIPFASEVNTSAVTPTISLTEADTSNATNFATITADRATEDITAAKELVYHVDCRSRKRYLKLTITPGTTTNDTAVLAAIVTASRKDQAPSSTTGMVATTNDAVVLV